MRSILPTTAISASLFAIAATMHGCSSETENNRKTESGDEQALQSDDSVRAADQSSVFMLLPELSQPVDRLVLTFHENVDLASNKDRQETFPYEKDKEIKVEGLPAGDYLVRAEVFQKDSLVFTGQSTTFIFANKKNSLAIELKLAKAPDSKGDVDITITESDLPWFCQDLVPAVCIAQYEPASCEFVSLDKKVELHVEAASNSCHARSQLAAKACALKDKAKLASLPDTLEEFNKLSKCRTASLTRGTVIDAKAKSGCSFLIKLSNGKTIEPVFGLAKEFQVDGKRIRFDYVKENLASKCQSGDVVKVSNVKAE